MIRDPVADFRAECDAITALVARHFPKAGKGDWTAPTLFKAWTPADIFAHLHIWNEAAHLSLTDPEAFRAFVADALPRVAARGHRGFGREWMAGRSGEGVFETWRAFLPAMTDAFADADPEARVEWAGPPMSARSSLVARQMEHWAHTQALHDLLGEPRINTDRLHPIAELGVRTYSFSHRIRGIEPPRPKPHVRLVAPSGSVWEWNEPQTENRVEGPAEDFCQVVTQCRNVGDTALVCTGETAKRWMATAQCFAGAAEEPPGVGERG